VSIGSGREEAVECSWSNLEEEWMVLSDDLEKGQSAEVPNCNSGYRDTTLLPRDNLGAA
jgi:hypothetical protein